MTAAEQVAPVDTLLRADTTRIEADSPDIIKMKAIGRYDRGIRNYRFIPKRNWIFGISASYANYDSSEIQFLDFIKDFNFYGRTLSVNPFVGYALRDNIVVGMKVGYEQLMANLDNFSLTIDDIDITLKDMRFSEDLYRVSFFHRSYVGLDAGKRFGLFNETELAYSFGDTRLRRGVTEEETFQDVTTRINQLRLGVNPGVSVFIMENVSVECSFGVVGFRYRDEKQKTNSVESGSRRTSGANFKVNILNISLGLTVCM